MAKNQVIGAISVDSAADNGKVPVYNSTTGTFDMTTPGGGGGGSVYDTGWVAATGGDWTQATLGTTYGSDVSHNLGTPASQLIVKLLASSDQTEANSVVIPMGSNANDGSYDEFGWQVTPVDNNTLTVKTAIAGVTYIRQNGNGAGFIINSGSTYNQYYKVVVFKIA